MSYLLIHGDAVRLPLADRSVHCVVTSPPYWGLRDYGTARWEGGNPECEHTGVIARTGPAGTEKQASNRGDLSVMSGNCACGARRIDGQLGLEPTPEQYIYRMVEVFRELKRVLRDDGTCWVNVGDSYAGSGKGPSNSLSRPHQCMSNVAAAPKGWLSIPSGQKQKDLVGIPWRLAFALQADGWYLRSDIIWAKPNPMPESVTDRPTKSHEYVFLLSKSQTYYFDAEAVRDIRTSNHDASVYRGQCYVNGETNNGQLGNRGHKGDKTVDMESGRNIRSVWTIPTEAYPGSHFATFPRRLVEPCIKAGTSERGCCPECGKPWERVVKASGEWRAQHDRIGKHNGDIYRPNPGGGIAGINTTPKRDTTGWRPTCPHNAAPVPAVVFDPFIGSGTAIVVANALGRHGIGLDLSAAYLEQARQRIEHPHAPIPRPGKQETYPLWEK